MVETDDAMIYSAPSAKAAEGVIAPLWGAHAGADGGAGRVFRLGRSLRGRR